LLKTRLIHPEILKVLAENGHGSRVLIVDGNYPVLTKTPDGIPKIFLNLAPGLVNVTDVLKVLGDTINIEAAMVMTPENGEEPSVFAEFKALLNGLELTKLGRAEFYQRALDDRDLALVIVTGEQRFYANILLIMGVV
jgi:L-fucose mutarotase